jgi:hypothetical protein
MAFGAKDTVVEDTNKPSGFGGRDTVVSESKPKEKTVPSYLSDFSVPTAENIKKSERQAQILAAQDELSKPGVIEKTLASPEALFALGVNIPVSAVGAVVSGGKREPTEAFMQKYGYQPRTRGAQGLLQDVSKLAEPLSSLPPVIGTAPLISGSLAAGPRVIRQAAVESKPAQVAKKAGELVSEKVVEPVVGRVVTPVGRMTVGTSQQEVADAAKQFEKLGFVLEPAQLKKDKPIQTPGFMEANQKKNEDLATMLATRETGSPTLDVTPEYLNKRMKELGGNYDVIFNRSFTIDADLAQQLKRMVEFEQRVNPAGQRTVSNVATNIINRWNDVVIDTQAKQLQRRIQRITQQQGRGGVEPVVRLRRDWPTIRNTTTSTDLPDWYPSVEKTINELSENLGLVTKPTVWVSSPRREGLYGMATGDGHIVINDKLDMNGAVATALHEFGHQAEFQLLVHAPKEQQSAVMSAWRNQMANIPVGKLTVEQHRPLTAEKYGPASRGAIPEKGYEQGYLRNFSEWFAEQTSRWITTTKTPTTLVEKFFAKVADNWKKVYQRVVGYVPLKKEVDDFYRANWKGDMLDYAERELTGVSTSGEPMLNVKDLVAKIDGKELQRLRSEMQKISRSASDGNDRFTAGEFVKAIDEGLGRYDKPALDKLRDTNRKYAATYVLGEGKTKVAPQGKIDLEALGRYLENNTYGFGTGTSSHPLYDLAYKGKLLGMRSRFRGVELPEREGVMSLIGRGKYMLGSALGTRTQLARDLQRLATEKELKREGK